MKDSWISATIAFLALLVLGLILLPINGGSNRYSPTTACLSNTKQMGVALLLYSADFDERFPKSQSWMDQTRAYIKNEGVYRCPSFKGAEDRYGYAFNAWLSMAKMPKDPAAIPMIYESTSLGRNASDGLISLPRPGRHKGKNTICYADGHAKALKMPR